MICWKSKLQTPLATSTTHAEFVAVADAAMNILFLARLLEETYSFNPFPVMLHEDNSSCVQICSKPMLRDKLKYLEKKLLDIKHLFESKLLKTVKIGTKEQQADILTKPLTGEQYTILVKTLVHPIV